MKQYMKDWIMGKFRIYLVLAAAGAVFALPANEPEDTLNRYFSFFNPGNPGGLEEFRSCFVPESRERIRTVPSAETRNSAPVGQVRIMDELRSSRRYEIRYRLENRRGTGFLVLENRSGTWLINPELSNSLRSSTEIPKDMAFPVPPNQQNPVPQPMPAPEPAPKQPMIPSGWQPGPSPEWHVDYRTAAERAAAERKNLYVLRTGPDWCGPCRRLEQEVFQTEEFKEYASKHLVLLYLNVPRRSPLPQEQQRHNQEIKTKFGFGGGVPSAVLLSPDGQIIGRQLGYGSPSAYMEFLRTGKTARRQRPTPPKPVQPAAPKTDRPAPPAVSGPPTHWFKGPDSSWQIFFPKALEDAGKRGKKIFVLNTGSDWCGWCVKLKKDVLSQREFKRFAQKNLILVYLDSPHKRVMPADQTRHNQEVKTRLGFGGGVPAVIILDENGQVIAKQNGYRPLKDFMKFLKKAVKK